jgi:DNA topoisomerase-1
MPARRLRRADCSAPGIARRGAGRGFTYLDAGGRRIGICPDPFGHLQATGIDAAGRKQYRYHDRWRERRDARKFVDMLNFGRSLPRLRRRIARDIRGEELSRERVLACAVRLLDLGFFRVGGEG